MIQEHLRWIFVGTAFLLAVLDPGTSLGQREARPETMSPEEVRAEIKRLNEEIQAWKDSKDAPREWKLFQEADEAYEHRRRIDAAEQRKLAQRRSWLERMKEVHQWQLGFAKLEERLEELNLIDRGVVRKAGVELFQARHAELAKHSTKTPKLAAIGLNALNYPRIDGSTSTQPLAVLMTCHCFGASCAWKGTAQYRREVLSAYPIDKFFQQWRTEAEADLMEFSLVAKPDAQTTERLAVIINHLLAANASTNQAYLNLIDGRSDLGLLARRPSDSELTHAAEAHVELDVQPCALDAFVFLVNDKNPVNDLTVKQIQNIYAGKLKNWNEAGGTANKIHAYQREENSGSQELMINLVMKDIPMAEPNDYRVQLVGRFMSSTYLQLTSDVEGIGYSVYYYERYMFGSPRTRTIRVDGVEPNSDMIASRKYPFVSEVFVVTRKGIPSDAPAVKLRAWLLSREGQAVVRESGYVPLEPIDKP